MLVQDQHTKFIPHVDIKHTANGEILGYLSVYAFDSQGYVYALNPAFSCIEANEQQD